MPSNNWHRLISNPVKICAEANLRLTYFRHKLCLWNNPEAAPQNLSVFNIKAFGGGLQTTILISHELPSVLSDVTFSISYHPLQWYSGTVITYTGTALPWILAY
jgi:hypothetical protein